MNILVTGAAGFIGSHLCEHLLKQAHAVVGMDNMNAFYDPELKRDNLIEIEKLADALKRDFAFYQADIRHEQQVHQICREHRIDTIIHLAAMAGVRPSLQNPLLYEEVNQLGTLTLLEAARKLGIRKILFGSSSSVYGNNQKVPFHEDDPVDQPISPYAATKRAGELSCHIYYKIYGISIVCLRFFTVYGPRQRPDLAIRKFTRLILQGQKVPIFGDGSFSRDFTYIDDIIDGVYKALLWIAKEAAPRYQIFNLGEARTTSVNELVELIAKACGKHAEKQYLPEQPGDVKITYADVARAKEVLGYTPCTPIEEGIGKFAEWYVKTGQRV